MLSLLTHAVLLHEPSWSSSSPRLLTCEPLLLAKRWTACSGATFPSAMMASSASSTPFRENIMLAMINSFWQSVQHIKHWADSHVLPVRCHRVGMILSGPFPLSVLFGWEPRQHSAMGNRNAEDLQYPQASTSSKSTDSCSRLSFAFFALPFGLGSQLA